MLSIWTLLIAETATVPIEGTIVIALISIVSSITFLGIILKNGINKR
ncbi:MAG: hypothetical protein ACFFFB_12480 [Candidatus Heimdallarchaeota archaeon]